MLVKNARIGRKPSPTELLIRRPFSSASMQADPLGSGLFPSRNTASIGALIVVKVEELIFASLRGKERPVEVPLRIPAPLLHLVQGICGNLAGSDGNHEGVPSKLLFASELHLEH